MGLIAFFGFWVITIKIWVLEGPKIPLIFIALWIAGCWIIAKHFTASGYVMMSYQAFLALIMLLIDKCKNAMRKY